MIRSFALATATVALMSGAAFAADLSVPETPYVPESTGFSWDGLYAGVGVGGYFTDGYDIEPQVSGVVGVTVALDSFVLGAELEGVYAFEVDGIPEWYHVLVKGRAGYLITPSVLLYGVAGVGVWEYADSDNGEGSGIYALGAGVEAAVSDSISLRAEVLGLGYEDGDGLEDAEGRVSVLFHF